LDFLGKHRRYSHNGVDSPRMFNKLYIYNVLGDLERLVWACWGRSNASTIATATNYEQAPTTSWERRRLLYDAFTQDLIKALGPNNPRTVSHDAGHVEAGTCS
jgi:hypothetical protein